MPWRRCQLCCLTFSLSASGCTQSSWSIENGKGILFDLVLAAMMLRKTHFSKRHCRLPAVSIHECTPSCAGTSTFAQGRSSMRTMRRMGSTRHRWPRSRPWDPPALPRGWSTLSWAPALHSELPCVPCSRAVSAHEEECLFISGGPGLFWPGSSSGKAAFYGPCGAGKGEARFPGCGRARRLAACFSCILGITLYAQLSLGQHRSCLAWAASMEVGREHG